AERRKLAHHVARIDAVLGGDPYASGLTTTEDMERALGGGGSAPAPAPSQPAAPAPAPTAPQPMTQIIGARSAAGVQAVALPGCVAGLVTGVFQAIVNATTQQVRDYAQLVASLSHTADEFASDNVTPNQTRDWLAQRHPTDLQVVLPAPGQRGAPRL